MMVRALLLFCLLFIAVVEAKIKAGVAQFDITPPIDSPSAGFGYRMGTKMEGVLEPLVACALYIDNGSQKFVFCSVDHLGIPEWLIQEIINKVKREPELTDAAIYISSSHTHSGGGGFYDLPVIDKIIFGKYDSFLADLLVEGVSQAIIYSTKTLTEVEIGIGYGQVQKMSRFREKYKGEKIPPPQQIAMIKLVDQEGKLFSLLFSFASHPIILGRANLLFSPDWVGYTRNAVCQHYGENTKVLYVNGAQGDVCCATSGEDSREETCKKYGLKMAAHLIELCDSLATKEECSFECEKFNYELNLKPYNIPLKFFSPIKTQINLIVINGSHAFITIPGELSSIYDHKLKALSKELGFENITVFGLTNGAHGYIMPPEIWKGSQSIHLSLGGQYYGEWLMQKIEALLSQKNMVSK